MSLEKNIPEDWSIFLNDFIKSTSFGELSDKLNELQQTKTVFPEPQNIFKALENCSVKNTKVVLLGQDPYHTPSMATGLSFSVPSTNKVPPSLKNIFKELSTDLDIAPSNHGDLTHWSKQGVLMLNAILTVTAGKAASHRKIGWEEFTDNLIQTLSERQEHLVFLLWGKYAAKKAEIIDSNKHLVLIAAHPSPLARGAFFGSKPFSQTNNYLRLHNKKPINWQLPQDNPQTELFHL